MAAVDRLRWPGSALRRGKLATTEKKSAERRIGASRQYTSKFKVRWAPDPRLVGDHNTGASITHDPGLPAATATGRSRSSSETLPLVFFRGARRGRGSWCEETLSNGQECRPRPTHRGPAE